MIYLDVTSKDLDVYHTNVKMEGRVTDDGLIVLEHLGGDVIKSYKFYVSYPNGTMIGSKAYDDNWEIGEYRYPIDDITDIRLVNETVSLNVAVYTMNEDGNEQEIFKGELCGKASPPAYYLPPDNSSWYPGIPLLISSLRTDAIDEDLICLNFSVVPDVDALTYIYSWTVNGNPYAEVVMPFDSENDTTTTDYSGNGYDGELNGVTWTGNGVVGGAYYFDGGGEYITADLPSVFNDISNNDFTINLWINSDDVDDDWRMILMAYKDNSNFVKIFQYGTEIHFGICEDGIKMAMRTDTIANDTWYCICGVWDASKNNILLYVNGELFSEVGNRNYAMGGGANQLDIGHGTASSRFWLGYIDELEIYDRSLSHEQIYQNYVNSKDGYSDRRVIVAEETNLWEVWRCTMTPNDGVQDGTSLKSNTLQIIEYCGGD